MVEKLSNITEYKDLSCKIITNKEIYYTLVKDKKGYSIIQPLINLTNIVFTFDDYSSVDFFKNQQIILGIKDGILHKYSYDLAPKTYQLQIKLEAKFEEFKQVQAFDVSPSGNYIIFIQHPSEGNNLKVISIKDNRLMCEFKSTIHPGAGEWPQIKMNSNDTILIRKKLGKSIEIFNTKDFSNPVFSLTDVFEYELTEINEETNLILVRLKITESKKDKKKISNYVVSVFKCSNFEKPLIETAVSQTSRAKIIMSNSKRHALIHSISDESSKESYLGNTSLYYLNLDSLKIKKLSGLKEGPYHDFNFCNNSKFFYVCCGYQPSVTYSIDTETASNIVEICKDEKVNSILVSPDDRMIALVGLGSLLGDIVCLDNSEDKRNKKLLPIIGKAQCFGTHAVKWSQDSKILLSTVVSPYLNVDNDLKYLSYNCEHICSRIFDSNIYMGKFLNFNKLKENNNEVFSKGFEIEINKDSLVKKGQLESKQQSSTNTNSNKATNKKDVNNFNNKNTNQSLGQMPVFFNSSKK